jgi:2'-5' RNA ligase
VRVFTAVPLSQAFKQVLTDACATLHGSRPGLRWTRPEGMHVTLAFLGDIGDRGLQGAIVASVVEFRKKRQELPKRLAGEPGSD